MESFRETVALIRISCQHQFKVGLIYKSLDEFNVVLGKMIDIVVIQGKEREVVGQELLFDLAQLVTGEVEMLDIVII